MSTSDLMSFRTTYLRAVALAWADGGFRRALTATRGGAADVLHDTFGYAWPWDGITLTIVGDGGAVWNPVETGGWCGTLEDRLVLNLPLDPANIDVLAGGAGQRVGALADDPGRHAKALADYYQQRPTPLGGTSRPAPPGNPNVTNLEAYEPGLGSWSTFLEFGAVTLRAIALAWSNGDFRGAVGGKTTMPALAGWLGYNCPWNFNLQVVDASAKCSWDKDAGTWDLSRALNELVLLLPRAPDDLSIQAVALTAYNNTGDAYPFTCCP